MARGGSVAGSVLFLVASAASVPNAEEFVDELVNMPYLLGSIAFALGAWAIGIPFVLDVPTILLAVGFSALMGVAFGYWPARRAARLEPIDALRHT